MLLKAQGRTMSIERLNKFAPVDILVCPTSYSRDLASFSETTISGKEFIISKFSIQDTDYLPLKKGDRVTDSEMGTFILSRVTEMIVMGAVVGYRVRTS